MDFYVYDNIYTYNKREPFNGVPTSRLKVNSIDIPENHSFWFHTDMNLMRNNVNIQKRYVHIHKGIGSTNEMKFNKEPYHVSRSNMIYNPKEKRIEIGGGWMKKPMFAKKCIYYGSELPHKKMNIVGEWYYNFGMDSMIFIIDYSPQKIHFHWEDIEDPPTRAEQLNKIAELEIKIEAKEAVIAQRNTGLVSDL